MKSILILGAGIYQVPLIEKVKQRGYRAIVLSVPGDYPGIALADEFLPVNTTDEAGVVNAARSQGASAVITTGTDVAMRSLGAACDALGLPGPSHESARRATNKLDMKRAFKEGGVRSARFVLARTAEEASDAWGELATGSPSHAVMVKCPDRSGSRGISVARGTDEVEEAFRSAVDASICGYAIVEDLLVGHEIGVDGYVDKNGNVAFLAPHDKRVLSNGHTDVPVGHLMNATLVSELLSRTDVAEQVGLTARALAMRGCFFNMDVMLDDERMAWVIEAGVRAGATCIPEVIGGYYGFDYYDTMLDAALGIDPAFPERPAVGASEGRLLVTPRDAVATKTDAMDILGPIERHHGARLKASFDYPPGAALPHFQNGTSRIGQVFGTADNPEALATALDEARTQLAKAYARQNSLTAETTDWRSSGLRP